DDSYGAQRHAVDQLGKTLEAIEAALHGFFIELTLIIDAGSFQPSFTDAAMWLNAADRALYAAKDTGRNRVNVSAEMV
ncbi:hypothetical protein Q6272_33435, partial [Klebsiella pneumoniae]|nr:hypothetical protein [Klebsiella pneumoniae]